MSAKYIIFCIVLTLQYQLITSLDSCQKETCHECISDPNICVWCAENDFNGTRCMPQNSYEASWCPKSLQNPKNEVFTPKSKEFSSVSEQAVQIKPQQYNLKLRPGMPEKFNFSFKAAKDYPVDLYFLLDTSKTMNDIKDMTAKTGEDIYRAIKNLTNNVNLGFGTFIDKTMLPFAKYNDSEFSYSFRHRLKLVNDSNQFKDAVSRAPNGRSRDQQEGGLDALAQVLVCKEIIGWRNESRKIVVFLTDGSYHAAGDGKSAGLFQPYDGQCYTENNTYTKELELDYPSVGMINKLAAESDIIVLFVVEIRVEYIYRELMRVISGSQVATFDRHKINKEHDDKTILTILKDIYENISKKIKLIVKVKSGSKKDFKIAFDPDCTADTNNPACDVEVGDEKHLVGTVLYNGTEKAVVEVTIEGLGEKLTLDIDPIVSCDCERNIELSSEFCNKDKRICGQCSCSENRYGERCMCVKSENNGFRNNSTCIAEGSTEMCSNRGSCICGTCACRIGYNGKFCECNMDSCPRSVSSPDKVCDGEEHGICDCGRCKCKDNWSGDACDCNRLDTYCKEYNSESVCNNRGQCVCGKCQCEPTPEWDARNSQTEKCRVTPCTDPHCHEWQCGKLVECVKCHQRGNCSTCDHRIVTQVVESLTDELINSNEWQLCSKMTVELGCQTSFVYRYNDGNYTVELIVPKKADCAPNYYLFGGIFLLTLLLVGAGTLIAWKLLTDARDRHEYLKFMQQNKLDASGPNVNPLYEPPTTTFNNPAFRKKSVDFR